MEVALPGAVDKAALSIPVRHFDLEATLDSGQVFHWQRLGNGFAGAIGELPVWMAQTGESVLEVSGPGAPAVAGYLGLDHPVEEIWRSFPIGDAVLGRALAFSPGLRILRQPAWECLATFITSSLKQVAQIRRISLAIRARFGKALNVRGCDVHAYPAPEELAEAGETALRECGMGYRARSLHLAALRLAANEASLDAMAAIESDEELLDELRRFHGVGDKIANCVMLFGFGRLGSFPVDVWIERTLRRHYGKALGEEAPLARVREFASGHFGPYGGYAQQYLFHHARRGPGA